MAGELFYCRTKLLVFLFIGYIALKWHTWLPIRCETRSDLV